MSDVTSWDYMAGLAPASGLDRGPAPLQRHNAMCNGNVSGLGMGLARVIRSHIKRAGLRKQEIRESGIPFDGLKKNKTWGLLILNGISGLGARE